MPFALPPLPWSYDALSPTIDELTMRLHHSRHHDAHVAALNVALEGTGWAGRTVEELLADLTALPPGLRATVRHHGGGHANHSLFWESMAPDGGGDPAGALAAAIARDFGSAQELRRRLTGAGTAWVGSGWVWLVHDGAGLAVVATADEDSPVMHGQRPLLGIDVWEHASYLKHRDRRADYLEGWWNVVDWRRVADRHAAIGAPGAMS